MTPTALLIDDLITKPFARADALGRVYELPVNVKRTLYVSRLVLNAGEIIAWAKASGFTTTLPAGDMHVTVAFSKTPVDWSAAGDSFDRLQFSRGKRSVELLGEDGAAVLKFEAPELTQRWQQFRDAGASWDYASYQPHITLSYDPPQALPLVPYQGVIELGPEVYAEVASGWADAIKEHAAAPYIHSIKTALDELEARSVKRLREVLGQARDALISRVTRGRTLPDPRGVRLRGLPDLRSAVRDLLDQASARGGLDARREVRETRSQVKTHADPAAFRPRSAARWLREKELYVTDLLDQHVTADVRGILVNALKTGELNAVVADKIWTAFEAYIGDPTVLRGGEPLSPARLETIVRTNLTDAYNHGRMMEYTSEEMLPFLTAIRYSAILDERTTPVCAFLDGKLFSPTDPDLTDLLPPNHFNCRSIVVPVVVGEVVDEADFITPAEVGRARELADVKFLAAWDEARHPRVPAGSAEGGEFGPGGTRAERAQASYVPATREKQVRAAKFERTVALIIGGEDLGDHEPFDVLKGRHAVEVKAIIDGKNPKITMHPESLARKEKFLRREKAIGHTVAIDARGKTPVYYYRSGVGSFRLSAMVVVTRSELRERFK